MRRWGWLAAALLVSATAVAWAGCSSGETRVVVAAGTTLVDGRLLERVTDDYEAVRPGVVVSVVGAPSARALALARAGSADVTVTHDPEREERFIDEGGVAVAAEVFRSRFILAGPEEASRSLEGLDASEALELIAEQGHAFVTRADGSGTYQRERGLWQQAGVDPSGGDWYIETRQGMGLTLQVAAQRGAFVLVEWSVFLTAAEAVDLVDAAVNPVGLENPYRAMAVSGSPVEEASVDFVMWLQSPAGRESVMRANRQLYGVEVFAP